MKINIRQSLLFFSFIIVGGIGFIGFADYKSNQKLVDSAKWVQHTEQIIYLSANVLSLVKDIETASQGYVITSDHAFLESLPQPKSMFAKIAQLKQLTSDNQAQEVREDSLRLDMNRYLDFSYRLIELNNNQKQESKLAFIYIEQGRSFVKKIQQVIYEIQGEENVLLKIRQQTNENRIKAFNYFSVFIFILTAVFTILSLIATINYFLQNGDKEKRAAELIVANRELVYQNEEKEKRAAELIIANKELAFQNGEKEKRAAELIIANGELIFQNQEKEKRAAELIIANRELVFQNQEKEKRAAELIIANRELVFQNDLKERVGQEKILSERQLARAQQVAHMGSWELDFATKTIVLSVEACRIYGLESSNNHVSFTTWLTFIYPEDFEFVVKRIKMCRDSMLDFSFYYRIVYKGEFIRHIYLESKFEFDSSGNPIGLYGITHDVTAIKLAEEQIDFDRNNLAALINNTNDLMWSVDRNFKLITCNESFNKVIILLTGIPLAKGSDVLSVQFDKGRLERYRNYYEKAFSGETFTITDHLESPVETWSEISFYPIQKGNSVIGTACFSRDITERRLAELERTKITSDLSQRNIDLEQFTYIVSHNLRAPVANILGATSILNNPNLNPEEKELLGRGLYQSVLRLDNVIKDLNLVLQVKGATNEKKELVSFTEIVENIKISIKNIIDNDGIEIKQNFIEVDEWLTIKGYLYSIFYNLISNSIKYRRRDMPCKIEISSHRRSKIIELMFVDNGMGIDLDTRGDQVFGLYKRFHTEIEGKGMGLFMVKTQVETLGGRISLKSAVNKGTEFKIEFET